MRTSTWVQAAMLALSLPLAACTEKVAGNNTNTVTLPAPDSLTSISLDGAIHLQWADNAYAFAPSDFDHYRVYSTSYSIDANTCGTSWALEGTTVSPTFLVGALTNGVGLCFAVSAVSIDGTESTWSPLRNDTPRPDGLNVIVFTAAGNPLQSGFRFYKDLNNDGLVSRNELGLVGASTDTAMDFTITPDSAGNLYLTPKRAATDLMVYGNTPITALTDIDFAPISGYARSAIQAKPLWGYVFRFNEGAFYRYGGLRVSAVGTNYVIFDWSFQTDLGDPELLRVR